ncbi:MAG: Calx-beta domain-containing protein, partial [Verrucomicrobiales bacterium]
GESSAEFTINPIMDHESESEEIVLSILDNPLVSSLPPEPLTLTLEDAAAVSIVTVRHAIVDDSISGRVKLSRTGDLGEPLTVELTFSGSADNGDDYAPLPSTQVFAAGVSEIFIDIEPSTSEPSGTEPLIAWLSVTPDRTRYQVVEPGIAEVQFLTSADSVAPSFADWRGRYFPGDNRSDEELAAADADGNGLTNGFSYILGQDPAIWAPLGDCLFSIRVVDDRLELVTYSLPGVLDPQLTIDQSQNLKDWIPAGTMFSPAASEASNGLIQRTFRSRDVLRDLPSESTFRFRLEFREQPSTP